MTLERNEADREEKERPGVFVFFTWFFFYYWEMDMMVLPGLNTS